MKLQNTCKTGGNIGYQISKAIRLRGGGGQSPRAALSVDASPHNLPRNSALGTHWEL